MSPKRHSFIGLTWTEEKRELVEYVTSIPLDGEFSLRASVTINDLLPDRGYWWTVSKSCPLYGELLAYGRTRTFSGAKQALRKAISKARLEA